MLNGIGNNAIGIIKQGDIIKVFEKESLKEMVTLKDKIVELEDRLFRESEGILYKAVMEAIEKLLIEHVLEGAEGNQFKAARILGINRNTMRAKVKKLSINSNIYKR